MDIFLRIISNLRPGHASLMNKFIFVLITIVLVSCDCFQKASGIVLDKSTGRPLQNVSIRKYRPGDTTSLNSYRVITDSTGAFEYSAVSGGIGRCPDLVLFFSK